jgi:hypothetical protein
VFPFLAQVEVGTSLVRAEEGSEFKGLLCRRPPFGPDIHQQAAPCGPLAGEAAPEGRSSQRSLWPWNRSGGRKTVDSWTGSREEERERREGIRFGRLGGGDRW